MPKSDDDDEKWIYRDHTAAKHEVYRKYLTPWVNKLTTANQRAKQKNKIRVIDCFAGRGNYFDIEDTDPVSLKHLDTPTELAGSPQIILDVLTDRSDQFEEAECVLLEKNEENYQILKETIENTDGVADNINVRIINDPWQDVVLDVLDKTGKKRYPTLFYIDPFGFQSLDYDVITEIGRRKRHEFLITFMQRDINRFYETDDHEKAVETVFGDLEFRDAVDTYDSDNWEALVEIYTDRLEEEGPKFTFEYMITEPDSSQTVYYLVFGSNHPNGLHTMREVMSNCGTGGFAYAPRHPDPDLDRNQMTFGGGIELTKEYLIDRFAGYRIEFGDLVETCSEERPYETDTESDYREAIRELEDENKLSVVRLASVSTGIQRGDLIDFPD